MKWIIFPFISCLTIAAFAMGEDVSSEAVTVTTESNNVGDLLPDPCLNNSNVQDANAMAACEQLWQEQKKNIQPGINDTTITSTHKETTGPSLSPLPAWEQSLEPQSTTVTNTERETILPPTTVILPPSNNTTTVVTPGSSVGQNPSQLNESETITNKETTTTVQEGETDVVNKETTITNRDGHVESTTTSTESVYHSDAPP